MKDRRIVSAEPLKGRHFTIAACIRVPRYRTRDQYLIMEKGDFDGYSLKVQKLTGLMNFTTPNHGTFSCCMVDDGKYHHIALVQEDLELRFYLDGMKMYTFDVPGGLSGTDGRPVLGQDPDGGWRLYGEIRDVHTANRTFSSEEIQALARNTPENPRETRGPVPSAPLFEDPLFNSAKDGTVVWNPVEKNWWFIYMQIRNGNPGEGVSIHHATTFGAASSPDGLNWTYRGFLQGLEARPGRNTFWAPEILWQDGRFHGYFSHVVGIGPHWEGDRVIRHYVSDDIMNWKLVGELDGIGSNRCLDCCVYPLPDGRWGMLFKDEVVNETGFAIGDDLYHFKAAGHIDHGTLPVEGCDVFFWKGYYWMLGDDCYTYNGLRVYRSTDAINWERLDNILDTPGKRQFDENLGHHPEIVLNPETDEAYVFYWTQGYPMLPGVITEICLLQVAKLEYADGKLVCDRDKEFELHMPCREE